MGDSWWWEEVTHRSSDDVGPWGGLKLSLAGSTERGSVNEVLGSGFAGNPCGVLSGPWNS